MALNCDTFNIDNVIFEEVKHMESGNVKYMKLFVKYRYENGIVDRISIQTPELFSWGVQQYPKEGPAAGPISYSMSLVMFDSKKGPTEEERKTIKMFDDISEACKNHLKKESTQKEMCNYKLNALVDQLNPFYIKEDKGVPVPGVAPVLYPKLLTKYEKVRSADIVPEIITGMYDMEDKPIDPKTMMGARCSVIGDVVLNNIHIGLKMSFQFSLKDVIVCSTFTMPRRLFAPARPAVKSACSMFVNDEYVEENDEPVIKIQRRTS